MNSKHFGRIILKNSNNFVFSTSHTRIDGGATTYRGNASSTGLPLTYENLQTELRAFRRVVDGNGEVIDYQYEDIELIVPAALDDAADEAIGVGTYAPDSADYKPKTIQRVQKVVWPLLGAESKGATGSDTAWFLKIKNLGEDEPIKMYHREGLKIASKDDFDTMKMKTRGHARWAIGWTDPVGKWRGSKGDSAAYSS